MLRPSNTKINQDVLAALKAYPNGISSRRLNNYKFQSEYTDSQIWSAMKRLQKAGKVVMTVRGGGGAMTSYTLARYASRVPTLRAQAKEEQHPWIAKTSPKPKPKKRTFSDWFWGRK
jgi:hypothetical protein